MNFPIKLTVNSDDKLCHSFKVTLLTGPSLRSFTDKTKVIPKALLHRFLKIAGWRCNLRSEFINK
jgi:hypothetical protein